MPGRPGGMQRRIQKWLTPGIHPPEYKEAVIDYLLEYGRIQHTIWEVVADKWYILQEMDGVFSRRLTAEEAWKCSWKIEPHKKIRQLKIVHR